MTKIIRHARLTGPLIFTYQAITVRQLSVEGMMYGRLESIEILWTWSCSRLRTI